MSHAPTAPSNESSTKTPATSSATRLSPRSPRRRPTQRFGPFEEAIRAGLIKPVRVETLANLIGALIGAASREVADADDKPRAREHVGEALDALLQGLRQQ